MQISPTATIEWFVFSPRAEWKLSMIFWFHVDGSCQDELINLGVVFG